MGLFENMEKWVRSVFRIGRNWSLEFWSQSGLFFFSVCALSLSLKVVYPFLYLSCHLALREQLERVELPRGASLDEQHRGEAALTQLAKHGKVLKRELCVNHLGAAALLHGGDAILREVDGVERGASGAVHGPRTRRVHGTIRAVLR